MGGASERSKGATVEVASGQAPAAAISFVGGAINNASLAAASSTPSFCAIPIAITGAAIL